MKNGDEARWFQHSESLLLNPAALKGQCPTKYYSIKNTPTHRVKRPEGGDTDLSCHAAAHQSQILETTES